MKIMVCDKCGSIRRGDEHQYKCRTCGGEYKQVFTQAEFYEAISILSDFVSVHSHGKININRCDCMGCRGRRFLEQALQNKGGK